MKKLLLLFSLFIVTVGYSQSGSPLYSVSPYQDSIWMIDTTTLMSILPGVALTSSTGTVTGCNGLAEQPCTGILHVVFKVSGVTGRLIGTVNPSTGVITTIGNTGDNVAGITFGDQDKLYAVTGDGATVPSSLFKVNLSNAAMTFFTAFGAGSDGENICFNKDDGKIYHWSGRDTNPAMESADTLTGTVTTIVRTGYNYDEVFGSVYLGDSMFLLANLDQEFILVNADGFAVLTPFSTAPNWYKGLAFSNPLQASIATVDTTTFCPGDSAVFIANATWATGYQWYEGGVLVPGATSSTFAATQSGPVYVEVTDGICTITSNSDTISLLNLPNVGLMPGDSSICLGDTITLTGSSGGSSQWYMNGVMIPGQTTNTLEVYSSGVYNMTKTNTNGCTDSSAVGINIVVNNLPSVSLTPSSDTTYCFGDSILISGSSGGSSQWYMNGSLINGATSNTLYVSSDGYYNMVKTNSNGCSDSSAVGIMITGIDCSAGLKDLAGINSMRLYPSPVSEVLYMALEGEFTGEATVRLVGIDGKICLEDQIVLLPGINEFSLNTSTLTAGIYMVNIHFGEIKMSSKIVKQ